MIPIVKAWSTDQGIRVSSLGVQVHGGAGFIEQTGAAQFYRDARIFAIYDGTTGIQAIDLVGRKIQRDEGRTMRALIEAMTANLAEFGVAGEDLPALHDRLMPAMQRLGSGTDYILMPGKTDPNLALAVAQRDLGWGLHRKGGTNWNGYSIDIVGYRPTGALVDCLGDAEGQGRPQWSQVAGTLDWTRPVGGVDPPPPPPPGDLTARVVALEKEVAVHAARFRDISAAAVG